MPGLLTPPGIGLDRLYATQAQGPLTLIPSLTVAEEFNDNVFLNNTNKKSDFITQFTPGFTLAAQRPDLHLLASYNLTSEVYAKESSLDNAVARQALLATLSYQATRSVTLNLTDALAYAKNSNFASVSGISNGRQESLSNIFAPGIDVKLTPQTTWRLFGGYTLSRFSGAGSQDSDIYRIGTGLDYALTPRFTVTGAYDFGYLDISGEPTSYTHTPRVGGTYFFTPTLTATVSGGPSVLVSSQGSTVTPAVTARITKTASWGLMSLFYDRAISAAGGFGGPSDVQTMGGSISAFTLLRGLIVDFTPRYTISNTESIARTQNDIDALTLTLVASYQIARYIAVVGSYTFLHQTSSGTATTGPVSTFDVDQNRVNIGLRFGYPINFY